MKTKLTEQERKANRSIANKKYNETHKKDISLYHKNRRKIYGEELKLYSKEYYKKETKKCLLLSRQWAIDHKEIMTLRCKKRYEETVFFLQKQIHRKKFGNDIIFNMLIKIRDLRRFNRLILKNVKKENKKWESKFHKI